MQCDSGLTAGAHLQGSSPPDQHCVIFNGKDGKDVPFGHCSAVPVCAEGLGGNSVKSKYSCEIYTKTITVSNKSILTTIRIVFHDLHQGCQNHCIQRAKV